VSRDLLQRRSTDAAGNTTWRRSPLLEAAARGEVAVLDGVHRLARGMLYSAVGRLLHDRELELADGSRFVSPQHFERLLSDGLSPQDLEKCRIYRVHPSFRVLATAEPPGSSSKEAWLTAEVATLFHFHEVLPLPLAELREVCLPAAGGGGACRGGFDALAHFAGAVRSEARRAGGGADDAVGSELAAVALSLRQLKRAGQHLMATDSDVRGAVDRACSARLRFLRPAVQAKVHELLAASLKTSGAGVARRLEANDEKLSVSTLDGMLRIGLVELPQRMPAHEELVPEVEFVDTPQHIEALRNMLLDWKLGHHLLLVGNQGTGKNKVTDRLLELLRCEREYVQLHRDTTVQSLLLSQSLEAGIVQREDSALVRAVRHGRCLVVDEADKAALEVVCVLKALADDGELAIGDGRCIVRKDDPRTLAWASDNKDVPNAEEQFVEMSPGFRMIVLANRPGLPFLGNDFFRVCGDVFSCHVVDNPNVASEMALLKSCGPSVRQGHLEKLALLFSELREMADAGHIAYPYSTRELVKIVRHLEAFPDDPLELVLADVFSFDLADAARREVIFKVLSKYGLATSHETKDLLSGFANEQFDMEVEECDSADPGEEAT